MEASQAGEVRVQFLASVIFCQVGIALTAKLFPSPCPRFPDTGIAFQFPVLQLDMHDTVQQL